MTVVSVDSIEGNVTAVMYYWDNIYYKDGAEVPAHLVKEVLVGIEDGETGSELFAEPTPVQRCG